MATQELQIVAERQQLAGDGADQCGMVAIRKVGPADRALEQHVAEQGEAGGVVDEDDVARRVPRAVQDKSKRLVAQGDQVALVQPAVRRDVAGGEAEAGGLGFSCLEAGTGRARRGLRSVRPHASPARLAQCRRQFGRAAGVVQMTVGEQDALDGDAGLVDGGEDAVDLAARDRPPPRELASSHRTAQFCSNGVTGFTAPWSAPSFVVLRERREDRAEPRFWYISNAPLRRHPAVTNYIAGERLRPGPTVDEGRLKPGKNGLERLCVFSTTA